MSPVADRYERLARHFATTVAAVGPAQWTNQTPCPEWTARQLLQHMIDAQGLFVGFIGRSLGEGPAVDTDPVGAWDHAWHVVHELLSDPATAAQTYEGFRGPMTFEGGVDQFLCTDLVIHRWDLAWATAQTIDIDPREMATVRSSMAPLVDAMRSPRAFGPALEPRPGASPQEEFLAYFGRAG